MKFAQTRLVTDEVAKLARFYEILTGVSPNGGDEYVEFDFDGGGLAICSKRSIDMFNAGAASPAANQSVILDFRVDDVDRERQRLQGLIQHFVLEPVNQPWANRSMLFRDPDGNLINVFNVIPDNLKTPEESI